MSSTPTNTRRLADEFDQRLEEPSRHGSNFISLVELEAVRQSFSGKKIKTEFSDFRVKLLPKKRNGLTKLLWIKMEKSCSLELVIKNLLIGIDHELQGHSGIFGTHRLRCPISHISPLQCQYLTAFPFLHPSSAILTSSSSNASGIPPRKFFSTKGSIPENHAKTAVIQHMPMGKQINKNRSPRMTSKPLRIPTPSNAWTVGTI